MHADKCALACISADFLQQERRQGISNMTVGAVKILLTACYLDKEVEKVMASSMHACT